MGIKTLAFSSGITFEKSRFFLYRFLLYFSFLLVPVWIQKTRSLDHGWHALLMLLYISFICGQWYLLGKEVDHRFKIYYRLNSSMDRVLYRLFVGMMAFVLIFNLFELIPIRQVKHFFWGLWIVLGLFYSWPTRGKIIRETVSSELGEFKFLDPFEKSVLYLGLITFLFSVPEIPHLNNIEALKIYFDPMGKFSPQFWSFMTFTYFPFLKYPELFKYAWCMHFYMVGLGLYLLCFYALSRFFVSRRLSLLGTFALISSWSWTKILGQNFDNSVTTTLSLFWVWSLLWVEKSGTYRTGLLIGLFAHYAGLINRFHFFAFLITFSFFLLVCLREKNLWFKKQLIKYSLFGLSLGLLTFLLSDSSFSDQMGLSFDYMIEQIEKVYSRKAFFILSLFGIVGLFAYVFFSKRGKRSDLKFDDQRFLWMLQVSGMIVIFALVYDYKLFSYFALMWPIALLGLIPLEFLFQKISRLRSRRNIIYALYILTCLLDSHFEGRVKIFMRLFD